MIDGSYVKAHQYGTSAVGGNQAAGRTKGADYRTSSGGGRLKNTDEDAGHSREQWLIVPKRRRLLKALKRSICWRRRRMRGMAPVIQSKRNQKAAREYDCALYQARHIVENGFGKLKEWRRVMPKIRRCIWRFARYAPWRCGAK